MFGGYGEIDPKTRIFALFQGDSFFAHYATPLMEFTEREANPTHILLLLDNV